MSILIIGEKPNVGKAISSVVGADKVRKGYIEGNGYIVSWCVGHLVGLMFPNDYGNGWDQKWSFAQLPMIPDKWQFTVTDKTRGQFNLLKSLMNRDDISEIIDKPLFTDEDVIADIQRDENADVPFWEMPEVQGEQLTLFGDPEPIQQRKTEKPKSEFASGPVVDGVQVYEALAAEIDRGTGFVHGKFRVQDFYEKSRSQPNHPTTKELADFLKKEYGTGGHSGEGKISLVSYDSKGIDFSFENGEKFRHTWFNMATMVEQRLRENTYLSENEKEKWQAIKAERSAEENSEPYKVEIGDRFRHKATGVVSEVISLTGALPYYEDECTVKRLSGAFEITENLSQDYLLKSGLYEYIGKAEPEKEQPAPEKPDVTEQTKVSDKTKTESGEIKTPDTLPVVKNLSQLRKTIKPGIDFMFMGEFNYAFNNAGLVFFINTGDYQRIFKNSIHSKTSSV